MTKTSDHNVDRQQLAGMSPKDAICFLMEEHGFSKEDALDFWINNTANKYDDVITLTPEEFRKYDEESEEKALGGFTIGGKRKTD